MKLVSNGNNSFSFYAVNEQTGEETLMLEFVRHNPVNIDVIEKSIISELITKINELDQ